MGKINVPYLEINDNTSQRDKILMKCVFAFKGYLGNQHGQKGAFFWDYSGYSYSGLGITEYTKFQFRKNAPSENGIPMAKVT